MKEILDELGITELNLNDKVLVVENAIAVKDEGDYWKIVDALAETEIMYSNEYDNKTGLGLIVL